VKCYTFKSLANDTRDCLKYYLINVSNIISTKIALNKHEYALESRLEQFGVIYYRPLIRRSDRNRNSLDISPYWKILIQGVELLQGYA